MLLLKIILHALGALSFWGKYAGCCYSQDRTRLSQPFQTASLLGMKSQFFILLIWNSASIHMTRVIKVTRSRTTKENDFESDATMQQNWMAAMADRGRRVPD